jgi:fructokinase
VKASEQDLSWLYPDLTVEVACAQIFEQGPWIVVATLSAAGAFGLARGVRAWVSVPPG